MKRMRCGFTLIEMLVVIALAALMATIVAVSLTGSYRSARVEDAAGRIATHDRLSREYARRFGMSGRLVFDLGRGTVTRAAGDEGGSVGEGGGMELPSGVRVERMITAGGGGGGGEGAVKKTPDEQAVFSPVCLSGGEGGGDMC